MKNLWIFAISGLLTCLLYSCSSSRNSSASQNRKRTKITGVKPMVQNPNRSVINASGDGLSPGIGQLRTAGNEENATNIASNAIAKANAVIKEDQQKLEALTVEELVDKMIIAQQTEIKLCNSMARTTTNDQIKDYTQTVLNDHQQMQKDLRKLSAIKNIPFVTLTSVNTPKKTDMNFVQAMIANNRNLLALCTAGSNSKDPAIREFASKQLPTLRKHLEAAQDLTKIFKPAQMK